jgi:hypothetical protein
VGQQTFLWILFLVPNSFDLLHSVNYYLLVGGYLRRYSCSPCGGAPPPENILRALPAYPVCTLRRIGGKIINIVFRPISVGRVIVSIAIIIFFCRGKRCWLLWFVVYQVFFIPPRWIIIRLHYFCCRSSWLNFGGCSLRLFLGFFIFGSII